LKRIIFIILTFILINPFTEVKAQGVQTSFGKNRVQYGNFDWYFYRTSDFEVYYYPGGKNLAQYVLTFAGDFLHEIEKAIDFQASKRITIVIYNTYSDFQQSNITLIDESYNTGGYTPVVDNIAFVYFDGDHLSFNRRIKMSLAEVMLNEMIFGSTIQERLQNMVLINLPEWYYYGLISYLSGDVSLEEKEKFENGIEYEKFSKFGSLSTEDKILIGHFFWEYIGTVYGRNAVSNILYLTHVNKNIESGFDFVLGKAFQMIYADWYSFYRYQILSRETDKFQSLKYLVEHKKLPVKKEITQAELSPDGQYAAFSINKKGKTSLVLYNIGNEKKKIIFRQGYKVFEPFYDKNYPLIAWHPSGKKLTLIYEKKTFPYLMDYDLETRKFENKRQLEKLNKVLDFSYSSRGNQIVLSAIKEGSSDIFIYELRSNRLFPVTNDIFDDQSPCFFDNDKGILFSSNRSSTTLKRAQYDPENRFSSTYDIYYYDLDKKTNKIRQLTFTDNANETKPGAYNNKYISYLTDENGVKNRNSAYMDSLFQYILVKVDYQDTARFKADSFYFYINDTSLVQIDLLSLKDSLISLSDTFIVFKDTAYSFPVTNYLRSIMHYNLLASEQSVFELFREGKEYQMSVTPFPDDFEKAIPKRQSSLPMIEKYKTQKGEQGVFIPDSDEKRTFKTAESKPEKRTEEVISKDSFRYTFIAPYDEVLIDSSGADSQTFRITIRPAQLFENRHADDSVINISRTRFGSSSSYFVSFTPDYLVSQFDNSFLNSPYLLYYPNDPIQPINKVTNAFFMLGVNDLFKDYKVSGGVRVQGNLKGAEFIMAFEDLKHRLDKKYIFYRKGETFDDQFTKIRRLTYEGRIQLSYPFTRVAALKGDIFIRQDREITLASEHSSLLKPDVITTYAGTKLEYVFDNSQVIGQNSRIGNRYKFYVENFRNYTNFRDAFSVAGGDIRIYTRIHKELTWANRMAFATSFGDSKVAFIMGGMDNWLFPKYNEDIQVDPDINYIYRSLATQLRGFTQNIRNGNSYALLNSEIRFPIFKYFAALPMRSTFWESFMIVAFGDIGTAWTGPSPFAESNSLNKRIIYNNPLKITVVTVGDPLVYGFGVGLRAYLFGYYVKLDHAWGVESEQIFQQVTYLSLGFDF